MGKRFLHGQGIDDPVEMEYEGSVYSYVQDGLGSIVAMINTTDGSISASYRYDAWGNVEYSDGEIAQDNPYLFTGREYDWQTEVYYYRARSYDANLGRFLQQDPAGMIDGPNVYLYCGNDPVNGIDPSGLIKIYGQISTTDDDSDEENPWDDDEEEDWIVEDYFEQKFNEFFEWIEERPQASSIATTMVIAIITHICGTSYDKMGPRQM